MKVQLRAIIDSSVPSNTPLADKMRGEFGQPKDMVVGEYIIPDFRFPPEVVTINGQVSYAYAYNIREDGQTVGVYRRCVSHNIVIVPEGGQENVDAAH